MSAKRKKVVVDEQKNDDPPPPYGSQSYWENRYKKLKKGSKEDEEDLRYHSWYFTYAELRPLLLPLILGGRNESMQLILSNNVSEAEARNDDGDASTGQTNNKFEEGDEDKTKLDEAGEDRAETTDDLEEEEGEEEDENGEGSEDDENEEEEDEAESDENEQEDDEFEEVSDGDEEDSDEEETTLERDGLAKNGPISVLEVGCGDVPLGTELAAELIRLEEQTGEKATKIAKRVVCCDYSDSVIAAMKDELTKKTTDDTNHTQLSNIAEFVVEDARKMTHEDCTFDLVLEKGTLDAMLSDKESGAKNCVAIVTECARVLAVGGKKFDDDQQIDFAKLTRGGISFFLGKTGYIVIISHLNAHTPNGVEWLDAVVVPGLRAGGGKATWEVEVHGSDGHLDNVPDTDSSSSSPPSGSPGPCVYIILKKPPVDGHYDPENPPTIPLCFHSY